MTTLETVRDVASIVSAALGALFFTAGTVGLLRFPDLRSRLHAVTKADTLGLGFVMLALALHAESGWQAAKYGLIWVLAMTAAAVAATLLGSGPEGSGGGPAGSDGGPEGPAGRGAAEGAPT